MTENAACFGDRIWDALEDFAVRLINAAKIIKHALTLIADFVRVSEWRGPVFLERVCLQISTIPARDDGAMSVPAHEMLRFDTAGQFVYWGNTRLSVYRGREFDVFQAIVDARWRVVAYPRLHHLMGDTGSKLMKTTCALADAVKRINNELRRVHAPIKIKAARAHGYRMVRAQ